jgi:MFS family permease
MMTLALRVAEIDPDHKESVLGLMLGIGAVVSIVTNPLAGYFSDRTRSSFGKRKIWMVFGTLVGFLGLWLIAWGDVPIMVVGWCLTQLGMNSLAAALAALLPDQVPDNYRGTISGALGMCIPAGMVAGIALVNFSAGNTYMMFLIEPAILLLTVVALCSVYKDKPALQDDCEKFTLKKIAKDFYFNPMERLDFTWAFVSRFMFFMALATFFGYQVYFLMDRLGVSAGKIPQVMLELNMITCAIQIFSSFVSGWFSDLLKSRKIFIWTSAAFYGFGLLMVGYSKDYNAFLYGACVMSAAFGVYLAVDMALVSEVLPDPQNNAARDLGIFNVAGTLPQTLSPAIAPLFLFMGGSAVPDYNTLFIVAAVYALFGAIAIKPIKSVR